MEFIESESAKEIDVGRTKRPPHEYTSAPGRTLHALTNRLVVEALASGKGKKAETEDDNDDRNVSRGTASAGSDDRAYDSSGQEDEAADTVGSTPRTRKRRFNKSEIALLDLKLERGELRRREDREKMARCLSNGQGEVTERQLRHWMANHKKSKRKKELERP